MQEERKLETVKGELTGELYPPDTLFLREVVATATAPSGVEYEVSHSNSSVIVHRVSRGNTPGGKWFIITARNLVEFYLENVEKIECEKK